MICEIEAILAWNQQADAPLLRFMTYMEGESPEA